MYLHQGLPGCSSREKYITKIIYGTILEFQQPGAKKTNFPDFIFESKPNIMNTTDNFPTTNSENQPVKKDYRNVVIGVLAAGIIGLGAYLAVDKNKTGEVIKQQETQIATVSTEKSEVQKSFDASLARLDSMSTINTGLQSQLTEKNSEITKVKAEIRSILNKKNATAAELSRAKSLIGTLNGKIETMEAEIARLSQDNQTLTQDKAVLTQE